MVLSKKELACLILIVVVAALLRLYKLEEIPPGLSGDTAYKGVAASRILEGEYPIFFEESWGGVEPLYMYALAAFFRLLGATPLVIKLLSALIGIVTVPVLHLLARELFHSKLVGLLASSWLALSYWHVSYSRLGWEIILAPLFVTVTIFFLWRGLESGRWRDFVGGGLSLGLGLYTYQAMRFLPILVILYLGYRTLTDGQFWRAHRAKLAAFLAIALLVFLPLGGYFLTHSEAFFRRAAEVSIFNPDKNPAGPLRSLVSSAVKIPGMYNLRGDPFWRHNLPGRPAFDCLTSVCFLLGLGIALARRQKPAHLLLLLWLLIMSLPPILTPPRDVPHFSRSIGALPVACIFSAIGVQGTWGWLRARWPSPRVQPLFGLSVLAILVTAGLLTFRDYFVVWAGNGDLRNHYFDGEFVDVAQAMNQLDEPEGFWILPITSLASPHDEAGHHTIEFLYRGQAPLHFLRLDEATVAEELSDLSRGYARALVVDYKNYLVEEAYNYIDADPKQLMPFLLGKYGQEAGRKQFDGFDVIIYDLPDSPDFTISGSFGVVSVDFGGQLLLTGVDYGGYSNYHGEETGEELPKTLPSGKHASVVLQWQALTELAANYKVALYLLDQHERVVGQVDKVLLSNHMRMTSGWELGQVQMDYYTLPNLPATPPGEYVIELAVYDAETMQRLAVRDEAGQVVGHSYTLGHVQITEPLAPPVVQPGETVTDGLMDSELRLLGYDLPLRDVRPREALEAALYWKALADVQKDYTVLLRVRDDEGQVWGEEESKPAYGSYPTTQWEKGEIVRDWHEVPIEPETQDGEYHLYVAMSEGGRLTREIELGTITVSGRPRRYQIPEMGHEVGWTLGEGVALLGYDVDDEVRAGETLKLTLYWQCAKEMGQSYTVFTHLLDQDNVIRGQLDTIPVGGEVPTTSWLEGEVIVDHYAIPVDEGAAGGQYSIEVGMYNLRTGERLQAWDQGRNPVGDRIVLQQVEVLPRR